MVTWYCTQRLPLAPLLQCHSTVRHISADSNPSLRKRAASLVFARGALRAGAGVVGAPSERARRAPGAPLTIVRSTDDSPQHLL